MKYKFTLTEDVTLFLPISLPGFKNEWVHISGNKITVKKGYSWDGCTPKLRIGDLGYIGTPDGTLNMETGYPVTYYCSLVHDVLYQWKSEHNVSRLEADIVFLLMLKEIDFSKAEIYYIFVRIFGWLYGKWNNN